MRWRVACALGILTILALLTTACERKAVQLTGAVTSSETGVPLSGVAVRLGNVQTTTDRSGKYAVSVGRPGSQTLYAWLNGYEPYSTEITVGSSSAEWNLELLPQPAAATEASTESQAHPSGQQTGTSAAGIPPAQPTVPGVGEVGQGRTSAQVPSGMVLIPAGSFEMGNSLGDVGIYGEALSDERPVHTVYVSAFFMDRYEVTKALWDEVARWAAAHDYDVVPADGKSTASTHPVWSVSWYEAVKWANARSEKEGLTPCYTTGFGNVYRASEGRPICDWGANGYRLPTEAEWEKAARGGDGEHRFPWSDTDTIQHARANYSSFDSSAEAFKVRNYSYDTSPTKGFHPAYARVGDAGTSPAGSFAPNGYGLYDMAGNVSEWCWDLYHEAAYDPDYVFQPRNDPRGPSQADLTQWNWADGPVMRGGSWEFSAGDCRVAARGHSGPSYEDNSVGFRLVKASS